MLAPTPSRLRIVALVAGLLGFVLAALTPLLPVEQEAAGIDWPQAGAQSVSAPLVTYAPSSFAATIPCGALDGLPGDGVLLATVPKGAGSAAATEGLVVREEGGTVSVMLRDNPLASFPANPRCTEIAIDSTAAHTAVRVTGLPDEHAIDVPRDLRPQLVGIFTDLPSVPAGMHAHADIDSRFTSTPSALKLAAMAGAVLATLVALVALHLLDTGDGRRGRRALPGGWWRIGGIDAVVAGTLVVWHVIGANTSDDGYILTMARVAGHAGYMANYFRWFGVPEAPFGWYYDVLALMTHVSTASVWMRLPALLAGLACWWVISREVLPRLGTRVRSTSKARRAADRIPTWTGGLVFLAFWLPYDNGLRPEPIIALGALLTWCSIERAIATGRLLPAAVAVLIAAFSLAAGPTGLICLAALAAGARPVIRLVLKRGTNLWQRAALVAPGLAAGTVVLVAVFADQTLATVREATRVRTLIGPNVAWFDERVRWDALLTISPDGSLARRFGVFVMLLCLLVCIMQVLSKGGRIPGTARGPSIRLVGIVFASLLLMMFTPTKWTHHFGVYAGLAGSLAALAAVAVGPAAIRSARNRALFAAAVLFLLAMAFTSSNGWWYVSSYGIPWFDKPPSVAGKGFATLLLGLTVLALAWAGWLHIRGERDRPRTFSRRFARPGTFSRRFARPGKFTVAPLTAAAAFVVLFEVASLAKGAVTQWPAYSVAQQNLRSLAGQPCGLADEVLVERDPNAALLHPLSGAGATGDVADRDGLAASNTGFTPNGLPTDLTADTEDTAQGGANSVDSDVRTTSSTTAAGTGGGTSETAGINGSTAKLPFGLDPARTPVLGSYQRGEQKQASLTTRWYGLDRRGPLLTFAAAGRIKSVDKDGVVKYGQDVVVEYGRRSGGGGGVTTLGSLVPYDIGPNPSWRNLRVPLDQLPGDADAVRIVVTDNDITPRQWVAITPPRVPELDTLQHVVGRTEPGLLDWHVGLAFGCQRPFDHHDGVAEVPKFRILPDRGGADAANKWEDEIGGGPMGWIPLLLQETTVPTYLNHDWRRDWGQLETLTPRDSAATPAQLTVTDVTRSGLWQPGPIRTS